MAQRVKNQISIHEEVGSVPGLIQRLGILLYPKLQSRLHMWLRSSVAVSVASSCSSDSTLCLGTSSCCRCSTKKKRKKKKSLLDFSGGLAVKDSTLSLLWVRFNHGPGNFCMPWGCNQTAPPKPKNHAQVLSSIYISNKTKIKQNENQSLILKRKYCLARNMPGSIETIQAL